MLAELGRLLASCPTSASLAEYRHAAIEDNVLLKGSDAARRGTFRRLRELYGLSPDIRLFRALRDLWDAGEEARPLLGVLCAVARDSVFRSTAPFIIDAVTGDRITPNMLAEVVAQAFPDRYNERNLAKIGRNAASSWTQSGHLVGRSPKIRERVSATPASVAYALLLGYLCGDRGDGLFHTLWTNLLDSPEHVLREQAACAGREGWIEYRHTGGVTDVGFKHLLRQENDG